MPKVGDTMTDEAGTWTFLECPDDKFGWCRRVESGELVRGDGARFETPQVVSDARVHWQLDRMVEQAKRSGLTVIDLRSSRKP